MKILKSSMKKFYDLDKQYEIVMSYCIQGHGIIQTLVSQIRFILPVNGLFTAMEKFHLDFAKDVVC